MLVTDETGNKVWDAEYTPFGKQVSTEGKLDHVTQFTGKDLDEDTGLYYYNDRWYDQETGRFISEDPVRDPNNFNNEYTYCANNPLINIDPTGDSIVDDAVNFVKGLFGWNNSNNSQSKQTNSSSSTSSNSNTNNATANGTVTSDNGQITVKDSAGNTTATYNKEEMKRDFQTLAQMQQDGSPGAREAERAIKNKYKAFFDATRDPNGGVSVIGLRGWGVGTKTHDTAQIKGETNTYNDMLLTINESGNLDVQSRVNFEGTTATGTYGDKTLNAKGYPSIANGTYDLQSNSHLGKYNDVILTSNGSYKIPTIGENPQYPERGNPGYATGVEIHRGGNDWTWSEGCITIYAPPGDTSRWDRFISNFPTQPIGTRVGTLTLMDLR